MTNHNKDQTLTLHNLNDECLNEIFSYLSFNDVMNIKQVCHDWKLMCMKSLTMSHRLECKGGDWILSNKWNQKHYGKNLTNLKAMLNEYGESIKYFKIMDKYGSGASSKAISKYIITVLEYCRNIMHLNISARRPISMDAINSLIINCRKLRTITITCAAMDLDKNFIGLLENNEDLKSIYFTDRYHLTNEYHKYSPADVIKGINMLDNKSNFSRSRITAFSSSRTIEEDSVESCRSFYFDDSMIKAIKKNPSLGYLYMAGADFDIPQSINRSDKFMNVKYLDISYTHILYDFYIQDITEFYRELEALDISASQHVTDDGIRYICRLTKLKYLTMNHLMRVTDKVIGDLPCTLELLSCAQCIGIKDDGVIEFMGRARKLREIDLAFGSTTNATLDAAVEIANERTEDNILAINIHNNKIDMNKIPYIPSNLKILGLNEYIVYV